MSFLISFPRVVFYFLKLMIWHILLNFWLSLAYLRHFLIPVSEVCLPNFTQLANSPLKIWLKNRKPGGMQNFRGG